MSLAETVNAPQAEPGCASTSAGPESGAAGPVPGLRRSTGLPPAIERCLIHLSELVGQPLSRGDLMHEGPPSTPEPPERPEDAGAASGADRAEDGQGDPPGAPPGDPQAAALRQAIACARRAGLGVSLGRLRAEELTDPVLPVMMLMQDGGALIAERRLKSGALEVFDPGAGRRQICAEELARGFSGYALLLLPDETGGSGRHNRHWLWPAFAANRWSYAQVMLAALTSNILSLATSLFTMVVYDRILPNDAVDSLIALTIGVGLAIGFDFVIKSLRAGFVDHAGTRIDRAVGLRLFDHLLDLRLQARPGSTGAMANTLREFETLRDFFTSATLVALVDLPFVFLFLWVIHIIGGPLVMVPALAVPLAIVIGLSVQPRLAALGKRNAEEAQSKQSVLVEALSGLETVKAVGAEPLMRRRWASAVGRQADHGRASREATQFAVNATAMVQQLAQIGVVVHGAWLISSGQCSMGALIAAVILTGRTLAPLAQLVQMLTRLNQARVSYRQLDALMSAASERMRNGRWLSHPVLEGAISFEDVHFSYPGAQTESLRGVSFTLRPGEKVALLGPVGCGKSTVMRLLLGLYEADSGAVLIDGTDIRQIDPADLRANLGAVLQDICLFSGSVRDNIAMGTPGVGDAEVLAAARLAGADGFISRHPAGYDLHLRERGEGLSGGQRQTVTLARALVGAPPVLLLDEPTSGMDPQSEAGLIARLRADMPAATMIVITHRPSLLALVDRVIVLDQGRIVADGPKSLVQAAPRPVPSS